MKKLLAVLALSAVVASGAFAQLTVGFTGVQYFDSDSTGIQQAFENLKDGQGVYYGGFVEIIGRNMGLGVSFNFVPQSTYDYMSSAFDMMDYDVNVYLSYHLFGGRAFLDPFVNLGIGMRAYDYMDKDAAISAIDPYNTYNPYISEDSPLYGSLYWDAAVGLGVNLGPLGVFVKAAYNMNIKGVMKGTAGDDGYDYAGDGVYYPAGATYEIQPWDVKAFKWVFGAKLIL